MIYAANNVMTSNRLAYMTFESGARTATTHTVAHRFIAQHGHAARWEFTDTEITLDEVGSMFHMDGSPVHVHVPAEVL